MKFFKFRYYMRKLNVQSVCTVATAAVSIESLSLLSLKCARLSSFRNKVKRMMIIFVRKLVITWPWRYWVSNWTGNNLVIISVFFLKQKKVILYILIAEKEQSNAPLACLLTILEVHTGWLVNYHMIYYCNHFERHDVYSEALSFKISVPKLLAIFMKIMTKNYSSF